MLDGDESPSVTTALGSAGACPEIKHAGKVWKVGHPTQRAKATLEALAVRQAVHEVEALEGVVPAESYIKLSRGILDRIAAKHYKTWGAGWQEIVWGPSGGHLFFLSLLLENHADMTEELAQEIAVSQEMQVAAALSQVIPPFVCLLLNEHKGLSPKQRAEMLGDLTEAINRTTNQTPPAPTPATTVDSSPSGAKRSRKGRSAGASTQIKSPA